MAAIGEKVLAVFSVIWCLLIELVFVFQIPKFYLCEIIYNHAMSNLVQPESPQQSIGQLYM